MPIPVYLAMTQQEMQLAEHRPEHLALMDFCNGIEDSILILTDRKPWSLQEIRMLVKDHMKILLDFQRTDDENNRMIITELELLGLPFCATGIYAEEHNCAVFLPPLPLTSTLAEHIAPWRGRELWLELALDGQRITLTTDGSKEIYIPHAQHHQKSHADSKLHCHYHIRTTETAAEFTLWRCKEDIIALLEEAESLGIRLAVGLWQELK